MFDYFRRTNGKEQDPMSDIRKEVANTIAQEVRQKQEPISYEVFRDYEILMTKEQFPGLKKCAQYAIREAGIKEALENCRQATEKIAQEEATKLRKEVAESLGVNELLDPPVSKENPERKSLTESRWDEPFLEAQATDADYIAEVGAKTVLHGLRMAVQDCTRAARFSVGELAA
jgi:hypothetical protein